MKGTKIKHSKIKQLRKIFVCHGFVPKIYIKIFGEKLFDLNFTDENFNIKVLLVKRFNTKILQVNILNKILPVKFFWEQKYSQTKVCDNQHWTLLSVQNEAKRRCYTTFPGLLQRSPNFKDGIIDRLTKCLQVLLHIQQALLQDLHLQNGCCNYFTTRSSSC